MAQIIAFPGTTPAAPAAAPAQPERQPQPGAFPIVRPIRPHGPVRRQNHPDDEHTIRIARMARRFTDTAHALAQIEPDSETHRMALHMAGIADRLPCNNLRIFTTPDDVVAGLYDLWRQVRIANAEWDVCDLQRHDAAVRGDDAGSASWSERQDQADKRRWALYERMIRIPATSLSDVRNRKLDRSLHRGMGSIEWMRTYKPDLAAVIDDEIARLDAEKEARKAARCAKRDGPGQ